MSQETPNCTAAEGEYEWGVIKVSNERVNVGYRRINNIVLLFLSPTLVIVGSSVQPSGTMGKE